jgi:carbamoyltransferase
LGERPETVLTHILGVSCFFHDSAAALLRDGVLVAAAEEERFTRKKHDYGFPAQAIQFCLDAGKLIARDLDWVVFFEKPLVKFDRILMTSLATYPRSFRMFRESMTGWFGDKLWVKSTIEKTLGIDPGRILFSEHHMSHGASSFFCSPFEEAGILTVDGVGEWATASMGVGKGTTLRLDQELHFPHSLGLLYSVFTAFLGFEVNEGEYKVMGMAAYGQPRYLDEVRRLVRVYDDGSFALDLDYFSFEYSTRRAFTNRFLRLFGPPRDPKAPFFTTAAGQGPEELRHADADPQLAQANQRYADIAASVQAITEEILLRMAANLHRRTGLRKLCLAGGVALNGVANGRLLRETPFDELYVQPSAGDGGGALGAALWAHHALLGHPRGFVMEHAAWGREYGAGEVLQFLRESGIRYEAFDDDDALVDRVVDSLAAGRVVGWFRGRFEWGPRALGQRSILADPRRPEMKDVVNTKIKFREPYRPFAPSTLVDRVPDFFELPDARRHYPARFMLLVVGVKDGQREVIPAVTHVDGTARVQAVLPDVIPDYYRLIERFHQATGVPVLLNTSFNLRGEPIVNTPREAFATFRRSDLDLLVLDRFVVGKA